jgi:hypothetical protein
VTFSDDGIYTGVGTLAGSVSVYITFSLQVRINNDFSGLCSVACSCNRNFTTFRKLTTSSSLAWSLRLHLPWHNNWQEVKNSLCSAYLLIIKLNFTRKIPEVRFP